MMQLRRAWISVLALQFVYCVFHASPKTGSQLYGAERIVPASVEQAVQVIDLSRLPRFEQEASPQQVLPTQLRYTSSGSTRMSYDFHQKQLLDAGWKLLPQSNISAEYASGTFSKDGFTLSLTVTPGGEAGKVSVSLVNHGNIDFSGLPLPAGSKPLFAGPVSSMWTSSLPTKAAFNELEAALLKEGWIPYGDAGDQHFFRQNAVRLSVMVTTAPAQNGKTMIMYSSEQLSAELPAPPGAINLQYADITHQLSFETNQNRDEITHFYRQALAQSKWQATTENLVKIGFREHLIFRNPDRDLIELRLQTSDSRLRVQVTWSSAQEQERLDRAAAEASSKKKPAMAKIPFTVPAPATDVEPAATRIEFKVNSGTAKAVAQSMRVDLEKSGWKLDQKKLELQDPFGLLTFNKGEQEILIQYVDPGFLPAEMTVRAVRGEFELRKP